MLTHLTNKDEHSPVRRLVAAALLAVVLVLADHAFIGTQNAYAHLELPPSEAKKLYPKFPYEAVGTTDAAKQQFKPEEFKPNLPPDDPKAGHKGTSLDISQAVPTDLKELVGASPTLDGHMVTFRGEAIGDIINARSDMKWVLVEDPNGSALSVLMTEEQSQLIENLGRYGVKGSTLQVTGVYHIADIEQAGELDVRAYHVELLESGGPVETPVHLWKLVVGIIFLVGAGALGLVYNYLRKRSL